MHVLPERVAGENDSILVFLPRLLTPGGFHKVHVKLIVEEFLISADIDEAMRRTFDVKDPRKTSEVHLPDIVERGKTHLKFVCRSYFG